MTDIFPSMCYCHCVQWKPNQTSWTTSGVWKSNGWWNSSNSSCQSPVPFLQSVIATVAVIEHSWTPHLHAPTKEYRLRKAFQWLIQTLQCLGEIESSYLSLEVAKLPYSTHSYSVYGIFAAVICEDVWCNLDCQSLTMVLASGDAGPPSVIFDYRFWPLPISLLPRVLYRQHSGIPTMFTSSCCLLHSFPTWEWQQPQTLVQGTCSNLITVPRAYQCPSYQRGFSYLVLGIFLNFAGFGCTVTKCFAYVFTALSLRWLQNSRS